MALDRQDIERRDFPIARRGYEPSVVDAHLRRMADEMDQLRRSQRGGDTLATAASEQVRAIVEAAESTSADIARQAETEARTIRERAESEAQRERDEAAAQAREHVANVSQATQVMMQRVDAMESELGALLESLRTGANRLSADLTLLQGNMGELRAARSQAEAGGVVDELDIEAEGLYATDEVEELIEAELESEAALIGEPGLEPEPGLERPEPMMEPEFVDEPEPAPLGGGPVGGGADSEGARLIALNMALNGTPRDETDRYLAENFDLPDRQGLLDEVYSRVG